MNFKPQTYFDLSDCSFRSLFDDADFVWDVISKIRTYTHGKLVAGKNCHISETAHIREGVLLGDNVIIGHCVELKNCIVMSNSSVAHLNYIGDGIVGSDVNIAGGAMLANYRLDRKPVRVKTTEGFIETGLEKFSAIIGDASSVGANAVLNPGTILGKNSHVFPLTSVVGTYPDSSRIK